MYFCTEYDSPIGMLTLASDGRNLTGLWLPGQKYFGGSAAGQLSPRPDLPVFAQAAGWLDRYFAGARPAPFELPLAPQGGEFRQLVWQLLCEIPYGHTAAYGSIAEKATQRRGRPTGSRAVGGAVGHNPISIIIPCHRVVGAGGRLTGYAGGLERKAWLLKHEGACLPQVLK